MGDTLELKQSEGQGREGECYSLFGGPLSGTKKGRKKARKAM